MRNQSFKIKTNTMELAEIIYANRVIIGKKDLKYWEQIQEMIASIYCDIEMLNFTKPGDKTYEKVFSIIENLFKLKYRLSLVKYGLWETINEIYKHIEKLIKIMDLMLDAAKNWDKIKIQ